MFLKNSFFENIFQRGKNVFFGNPFFDLLYVDRAKMY